MTTSTTQSQTIERPSRMPSQRAFHIFRLAEIQGQSHKQIAELYKVSRRRISQIVERVKTWLSQHPCEDPQIASELQAKRLGQQGRLMAGMQILHVGPTRHGGIVRQQIRRSRGSASCRVDEIEPDRVTQQGELGLGDDG